MHRVDTILVANGLASSLDEARQLISAHRVRYGTQPVFNAGRMVKNHADVHVVPVKQWVGRGGHKLEAALKHWSIPVDGSVWLDIGAATGGFTDCLLHHGAERVYALDVGSGLLDHKLKSDPRVVDLPKTHVRFLGGLVFDPLPGFCVVDVSFMCLEFVLDKIRETFGSIPVMALYKPQFECGRDEEGFSGVVKKADTVLQHLPSSIDSFSQHWSPISLFPSPVRGRSGNVEFFISLGFCGTQSVSSIHDIVISSYGF